MTDIRADEQALDADAVVALFALDATALGGAAHRWVAGPWNGASASFGGVVYSPAPIQLAGAKQSLDGPLPRPTLALGRADAAVTAALLGIDDWRGARLTRTRTLARYLDGEPDADPTRHWPADVWLVDRLAEETKERVSWQLASPIDFDGRRLPGRQVLRDVCSWGYRRWVPAAGANPGRWDYAAAECPYVGAGTWTDEDAATADPALDRCSRRLSGCKLRFPGEEVPFGGFLGVARLRT